MAKLNFKHLVNETLNDIPLSEGNSIPRDRIVLDKDQVRKYFDPKKLETLAETIKAEGILENLGVYEISDRPGFYGLIFGERRYRASGIAGLTEIPVIILPPPNAQKRLLLQLIENVHQEDLNPLEELEAVLKLISLDLGVNRQQVIDMLAEMHNSVRRKEKTFNNESIAKKIINILQGLNIEWISFATNQVALLKLPEDVLDTLRQGKLEYTKALAIARVKDDKQRQQLLEKTLDKHLSVRQIREEISEDKLSTKQLENPAQEYKNRMKSVSQRLTKSKIWENSKKLKELEKHLDAIDNLLS